MGVSGKSKASATPSAIIYACAFGAGGGRSGWFTGVLVGALLGQATSKGHVKCSNGKGGFDARQSAAAARQSALASGLQMDEESFPGELAQALEVLEKKKDGPDVWNSCCQRRRPLRVLVHCYGGVNRTCAAYSVLMMAFASMSMERAIGKWIQHRAYYAPFKHREYMIEALLQMQEELHTYQLWKC